MKKYYIFFTPIGVICIVAILGYYGVNKLAVADQRTMEDLQKIHSQIAGYADLNKKLPAALTDLKLSSGVDERVGAYQYRVLNQSSYELCATFQQESKDRYGEESYYPDDGYNLPSTHKAGHQCFMLKEYSAETAPNFNIR